MTDPNPPSWRDQPTANVPAPIKRASTGELAIELQSRGWSVAKSVKRAPGPTGTLRGLSMLAVAQELERRCGRVVDEPRAGAK